MFLKALGKEQLMYGQEYNIGLIDANPETFPVVLDWLYPMLP